MFLQLVHLKYFHLLSTEKQTELNFDTWLGLEINGGIYLPLYLLFYYINSQSCKFLSYNEPISVSDIKIIKCFK